MIKYSKSNVSVSSSEMSSLSSFSTSSYTSFSVSAPNQSAMTDLKTYYTCSKCNRNYDIFLRNNMYVGRVPLILNCNHTMCEECIRISLAKREVICTECQHSSAIDENDKRKLQEIFPVNFYLMGIIYYSKPNMSEVSQLNLKPAGVSYKNRSRIGSTTSLNADDLSPKGSFSYQNAIKEKCCQVNCTKSAALRCAECDEVYCETCCQTLHKAARGLQTHKITPLSAGFVPELTDKCPAHKESPLEFHCNTCSKLLCCYCVLQGHSGHSYFQLTYVNDSDRTNFDTLIENAEEKLKRLIMAHKKVKWEITQNTIQSHGSAIEAEVAKYFTTMHAKLQCLEKKLRKDAAKANNSNLYILSELNSELLSNIRVLNSLIATAKSVNDPHPTVKLNVKVIIERLENALNLPCYFVGEQQDTNNARFVTGDLLENLENNFTISTDDSANSFRLVSEDEIPEGYDTTLPEELSLMDVSELNLASVAIAASPTLSSVIYKSEGQLTPSEMLANALKPKTPEIPVHSNAIEGWLESASDSTKGMDNLPSLKTDDRENVIVTHIDTPECFYVQLIRYSTYLETLSKEVVQYIRQFAPVVKNPELNKLYVVKYETKKGSSQWYRGRVIDIITNKTGETVYNILFIDYGNTQIVSLQKLREINSSLAKAKPFALQCKLFEVYPVQQEWDRKSMLLMAQIITGEINSIGPSSGNPRNNIRTDVILAVLNNSDGILEVDLLAVSGGEMSSIRDALIFIGFAIPCLNSDAPINYLKMKNTKPFPKLHTRTDSFKKGQEYEIFISHVVDPYNIYVQSAEYAYRIDHIGEVMNKHYSKSNRAQAFAKVNGENIYVPRKGMVVAVRYTEIPSVVWCRGTVTDIIDGQGMVKVFLVDYGKDVKISYTQIRKLPEQFRNLDCQAVLVKMAAVKPSNEQETWEPNATEFFSKYILNKDKLILTVVESSKPVEVALFERYSSMDVCINTLLSQEVFAISTGEISKKREWIQNEPEPKQESTYVMDLLNTIQCSKKTNVDSNSDEEEVDLKKVVRIPVRVLLTKNPDLIYVSVLTEGPQKMQRDLHLALQNFYCKHHMESKDWEVNDICVVYDRTKKQYFRAIILEKIDQLNYKVILRDIAEEHVVSKSKVGILQSQFTQFNEGAVRCHLAGVIPAGDANKWSGLAIEFLQSVFEKNTNIFMTRSGPLDTVRKSLPVIMWYSEFKPGEALEPSKTILHDINKLLVRNGLALKDRVLVASNLVSNSKQENTLETAKKTSLTLTPSLLDTAKELLQAVAEKSPEKMELGYKQVEPVQEKQPDDTTTVIKPSNQTEHTPKTQSTAQCTSTSLKDVKVEPLEALVEVIKTETVDEDSKQLSSSCSSIFDKTANKDDVQVKRPKSTEHFRTPYFEDHLHTSVSLHDSPVRVNTQQIVRTEQEIHDWNELIEQEHADSFHTSDSIDTEDTLNATDWQPPEPFTQDRFEACATFVDYNAFIYVHEAHLEPVIKAMEEQMKNFFDNTTAEPEGTIWVPGQLCTVKYFVNESWYRGKIISVGEEFIKVFLIDYGNEEDCRQDDLRFKVMYMNLPAFANKIQLHDVLPKLGSKWLTSDLDELHRKVVENKIFVELKGPVVPGVATPAIVKLDGVNINKLMLETSTNLVSSKHNYVLEQDDSGNTSDVIIEEQSDDPIGNESEGILGNLQYPLQDGNFVQNPLPDSLVGQKINVTVTSIISFNHFVFEILADQDIHETKTLFDSISEDIRNNAHKQPVLYDLQVGQACVTRFSEDGEWYRGQVSSIEGIKYGVVDVWFVDFGNSENVPRDTVRAIHSDWLKLPVLQYKGQIDGIELANSSCLNIVVEYMAEFCNTVKSAEIMSVNPLRVRLYNDNDQLAYQDLIDQNLLVCKN